MLGAFDETFCRGVAEAAGRIGQDAYEGFVVGGVEKDLQPGGEIADLGALGEFSSGDDSVGNAGAGGRGIDRTGVLATSDEDDLLAERNAVGFSELLGALDEVGSFLVGIVE